jgi:hypothetical protein
MFFAYNLNQMVSPEPIIPGVTPEALADLFVEIFVQGTLADPQPTGAEQ